MHHFMKIRNQMTSFLGQVQNNHHHTALSMKPRCRWCSHTSPFITPYTVVNFGSHHSVYFQLLRSCLLRWWLCGLWVLRGQWIWLLRLEAACRSCHRKWASPMGSVCHRRSNRPPGNLLVPTVSIWGFYLSQSATALFCQNKWCSDSCTQQFNADLKLIEQFEMWKFYHNV